MSMHMSDGVKRKTGSGEDVTSPLIPLKKMEVAVHKLIRVAIPLHMNILEKHKANIEKYQRSNEWNDAYKEQVNARRTVQQLTADIRDIEKLLQQVSSEDRDKLLEMVLPVRERVLQSVTVFIHMNKDQQHRYTSDIATRTTSPSLSSQSSSSLQTLVKVKVGSGKKESPNRVDATESDSSSRSPPMLSLPLTSSLPPTSSLTPTSSPSIASSRTPQRKEFNQRLVGNRIDIVELETSGLELEVELAEEASGDHHQQHHSPHQQHHSPHQQHHSPHHDHCDERLQKHYSKEDRERINKEIEEVENEKAAASALDELQNDLSGLCEMMTDIAGLVKEQGEDVDHISGNVETAKENVSVGKEYLRKASKFKAVALPVGGAALGTLLGGPVGLVLGLKLGVGAALFGASAGAVGGTMLKKKQGEEDKRVEDEVEMEEKVEAREEFEELCTGVNKEDESEESVKEKVVERVKESVEWVKKNVALSWGGNKIVAEDDERRE